MTADKKQIRNSTAEFLVFAAQNEADTIEVRFENQTLWLTRIVHGHTAAEPTMERANAERGHVGLTPWENAPGEDCPAARAPSPVEPPRVVEAGQLPGGLRVPR